MRKGPLSLFMPILFMLTTACASLFVTVLEQTADTAVIKGVDNTPDEAVIRAKNKGREIFAGEVELTKDATCTQEFRASQQGAQTFWTCVVSLRKAR